jgi:hypothetical protein
MSKATDIRICEVTTRRQQIDYRTPIKFGGRVVRDVTVVDAQVVVEDRIGRRHTGNGSMTMGNVWAWPSTSLDATATLSAMLNFVDRLTELAHGIQDVGDPLQLTERMALEYPGLRASIRESTGGGDEMPQLAALVAASPIEAAIHDAFARLHNRSAFACLDASWINEDLSHYLNEDFRGEYLSQYTLATPQATMPLYHLVGALDPLTTADIQEPVNDGLPQTLGEWILADGLDHLKLKLAGDDLDWDVQRVAAIDQVATEVQATRSCEAWWYSLDFNEKCPDIQYVLDFLCRLRELRPPAYDRIQYIEQPMHRDMSQGTGATSVGQAAKLKPVVIDESLLDFDSVLRAKELGYSGVALKACKGQTESLLMAAAAQKYQMFLCVQDLTCVGPSFLHSASLAAHIPTVAAIEGNGRQYCPRGNADWSGDYPGMFDVTTGCVETSTLAGIGLGFEWGQRGEWS